MAPHDPAPLPPEFELQRGADGLLALRRGAADALREAGFSLHTDGAGHAAGLAGRQPMHVIAARGEEFVVRRFTHGGMLRWLTGARFLSPERPLRELQLSEALVRHGVPTPQVVAARARKLAPWGWSLALVTRRVRDALDGGELLRLAARAGLRPRERSALYGAAGALIAKLHELGFLHADLHPKNLLFARSACAGWGAPMLLDLDRAEWRERLGDGERLANLRRLYRYVERRCTRGEYACSRADVARFMRGYCGERGRRHAQWRSVAAAHVRSLVWHRVGWALERAFGRG